MTMVLEVPIMQSVGDLKLLACATDTVDPGHGNPDRFEREERDAGGREP